MANRRGCFFRIVLVTIVFIFLVAAGVTAYWYLGPYQGFSGETFVEIEHGATTKQIANQLAEAGVVRSPWAFLVIRALHPRQRLQAGEYRFGSPQTPSEVFDKIHRGDVFYESLTIPEGSNIFDIAGLLEKIDTVDSNEFLKLASTPDLIRDLDPAAPSLEGYLFPSTYRLTHQTTAEQFCRMMMNEFRKQWAALGGTDRTADIHKIITLASLVEKESASPAERPLIAAVFENRLHINMPLQCDPTTVYAALLENRYQGVIHKSDLASVNPYNTYTHAGLPPGPIANPGAASLKAALHPAQTDYLYFVAKADGSGTHHFSSNLAEHEKAVAEYRKNTH